MNVTFYRFGKRRNSTKQPTGSGTTYACKLKDDCSAYNPILLLNTNTFDYNYAYISDFGKYYYVSDVVSKANALTEYHLTEDVLASYRTAIGNTTAYIAYASSNYNVFIVDPRMQVSTSSSSLIAAPSSSSDTEILFNHDFYLLTVFNNNGYKASGMCSTYYLSQSEIGNVADKLASQMSNLNTFFNGNALSGISSCKWIPYSLAGATTMYHKPYIGDRDLSTADATVLELADYPRLTYHYDYQWDYFQDFRRVHPYTRLVFYLPGVGSVEVNPGDFVGSDRIYLTVCIEGITGDVTYYIKRQNGAIINTYSCNVAADVPLGSIVGNASGAVNSAFGVIGGAGAAALGAFSGNMVAGFGGAATALASATNMALASNQKTTTVSGSIGSRGVSAQPSIRLAVFYNSTANPADTAYINRQGRPVCEYHTINTYSGYVQTIDAHPSIAGTEREIQEIENYLNSGIYYE